MGVTFIECKARKSGVYDTGAEAARFHPNLFAFELEFGETLECRFHEDVADVKIAMFKLEDCLGNGQANGDLLCNAQQLVRINALLLNKVQRVSQRVELLISL